MSRGLTLLALLLAAAGCQQKMADQPSYRKLEPSGFFPGGQSVQRPPAGTVAREWRRADDPLTSGLKPQFRDTVPAPAGAPPGGAATPEPAAPVDPGRFADAAPFGLTRDDLVRGQERYTIFCAVCHGPLGDGAGKIVQRGYVRPPSYHTDDSRGFARYRAAVPLRTAPLGYVFEVITRGYGAMPRYGPQIEPIDRWRVAAYVRALQVSQHAELATLPPTERQAAEAALGGQP